jgi:hypothetical protein
LAFSLRNQFVTSLFREDKTMYLSRLTFHTLPGKTHEVEEKLKALLTWVENAGGVNARIMRTHYGSLGAPDLIFEQEVKDPGTLETQIKTVTEKRDFEPWAAQVSALLEQSSKRELYEITATAPKARASLIVEAS